jgi:hypothetical protein
MQRWNDLYLGPLLRARVDRLRGELLRQWDDLPVGRLLCARDHRLRRCLL